MWEIGISKDKKSQNVQQLRLKQVKEKYNLALFLGLCDTTIKAKLILIIEASNEDIRYKIICKGNPNIIITYYMFKSQYNKGYHHV